MQNRLDRDQYLKIRLENVETKMRHNFETSYLYSKDYNTPYDYFSVMHYDTHAFSTNGLATIIPKQKRFAKIIGQRVKMSSGDKKRINAMYKCKKRQG